MASEVASPMLGYVVLVNRSGVISPDRWFPPEMASNKERAETAFHITKEKLKDEPGCQVFLESYEPALLGAMMKIGTLSRDVASDNPDVLLALLKGIQEVVKDALRAGQGGMSGRLVRGGRLVKKRYLGSE